MVWITPKVDWFLAAVATMDFNRIEGDIQYLYDNLQTNEDTSLNHEQVAIQIENWIGTKREYVYIYNNLITTNPWVINITTTENRFCIIARTNISNLANQSCVINGTTYTLLDGLGVNLVNNYITASSTNPITLFFIVDVLNNKAFVIADTELDYSILQNKPLINGVQLANNTPIVDLNINATQVYHGNQTINDALVSTVTAPGDLFMTGRTIYSGSYLLCDGRSLLVANYPELFAVIGYSFGGSGLNFNLPSRNNIILRTYIRIK